MEAIDILIKKPKPLVTEQEKYAHRGGDILDPEEQSHVRFDQFAHDGIQFDAAFLQQGQGRKYIHNTQRHYDQRHQ